MADDQSAAASLAIQQDESMGQQAFQEGFGALTTGESYLMNQYKTGGLSQAGKFSAEQTNAAEANPFDQLARAQAITNVTSQKVLSGLDEMDALRKQLAGQGLNTAGLAASAAQLQNKAISGMAPWNTAGSIAKGVAGVGSAAWGSYLDSQSSGGSGSTLQTTPTNFMGSQIDLGTPQGSPGFGDNLFGGGPQPNYFGGSVSSHG
jgi:hypothetical protein